MRLFNLFKQSRFLFRPGFHGDSRGGVAIEYALIGTALSIVIAAAVFTIGEILRDSYFNDIVAAFAG